MSHATAIPSAPQDDLATSGPDNVSASRASAERNATFVYRTTANSDPKAVSVSMLCYSVSRAKCFESDFARM